MITKEQFAKELERENSERQKPVCCGCGKPKELGLVVCWNCFKHCNTPYKYYQGSLEQWLELRGRL